MESSPSGPSPTSAPAHFSGNVGPAPQSTTVKWLLISVAILVALFLGLLTLVLMGLATGITGLIGGVVLALLPLPLYMLLVLWVDRFEKEPLWMLAAAFIWGATVSVFFAFILNTLFGVIALNVIPPYASLATAVISAPLVEELAKGMALVIFYFWKRDEFDNVLDGIIYAAMVGLGFAMTENILYYGKSFAAGGIGASIYVFVLRGVVSPFAHPLFTSMTGIGLGLAQLARKGSPIKFFAPVGGILLAMFLHCLWNLSASFGPVFVFAYGLVMFPAFVGILTLIVISLFAERHIIRQYLVADVQSGLLDARGYETLCSIPARIGASCRAFSRHGYGGWRTRTRFHETATELAFHRWRTSRGIFPRHQTPAAREAAYLQRLQALKSELHV